MTSDQHSSPFGIVRGALMASSKFKQSHADALNEIEEQCDNYAGYGEILEQKDARILELEEQLEALWDADRKSRIGADAQHEFYEMRLTEMAGVAGGVIWLDNNLRNYGSDGWREYFKAVLRDAQRAYETWKREHPDEASTPPSIPSSPPGSPSRSSPAPDAHE